MWSEFDTTGGDSKAQKNEVYPDASAILSSQPGTRCPRHTPGPAASGQSIITWPEPERSLASILALPARHLAWEEGQQRSNEEPLLNLALWYGRNSRMRMNVVKTEALYCFL
jgi:hypothetical protein